MKQGQTLLIIEAMKTMNPILPQAPAGSRRSSWPMRSWSNMTSRS